ncbi:MAG TPA: methyl-accepting chemotaxis protein [Spirochaetota bacterium]|nr:methyl-accepting chemotaxis protein [Spirochaetota bacterium]
MKLGLRTRFSLFIGLSIIVIALFSSSVYYFRYAAEIQNGIDARLTFAVLTIEKSIDFTRTEELFKAEADKSDYFNRTHEKLYELKQVFGLKYLYASVPREGKYIFVMDTANYTAARDYKAEDATFMKEYKDYPPAMEQAFRTGTLKITTEPYTDQWGTYLSAFYPVKVGGAVAAVVGADFDISEVMKLKRKAWIMFIFIIAGVIALTLVDIIILQGTILRPLLSIIESIRGTADNLDLTEKPGLRRNDEIGILAESFSQFIDVLRGLLQQVVSAAGSLTAEINDIAAGNENLSQRTSQQASSLEEIAATIEETSSMVKQNAQNAQNARDVSDNMARLTEEGSNVINQSITAISVINESSTRIADIIAVINDIAFQTNLLALNAAVEAARAGEHGRGFAVVAGEVRNLAQRSANAANEIGRIIKDSVEKMKSGTELAQKSSEALERILSATDDVRRLISEIAAASGEQSRGIEQVSSAVMELESMTQQNSALVEENASASASMAQQSQDLLEMVKRFRL